VKVDVDWTHGAGHMQASHQVTPEEADEALADIDAVWFDPDPHSKSGRSVRGDRLQPQPEQDSDRDPGPP
jgi:hypothetical protein